jgi:hypothetical protein
MLVESDAGCGAKVTGGGVGELIGASVLGAVGAMKGDAVASRLQPLIRIAAKKMRLFSFMCARVVISPLFR